MKTSDYSKKEKIFCVAQINHELVSNDHKHINIINIAADNYVDYIVFPELSLTGYTRSNISNLAYTIDDKRFAEYQYISKTKNIVITLGIPVEINKKYYIASVIFLVNGKIEFYLKQYLHPGEELVYSNTFDYDPVIKIGEELVCNAICYDIENNQHIEKAILKKSTIYSASIFYSKKGIDAGILHLQDIAKKNKIGVLVSNYCGNCWEIEAGGKSSIIDSNGNIVMQGNSNEECLLIAKKSIDLGKVKKINLTTAST